MRDILALQTTIDYCVHALHAPILLLIFPEGTDLSQSNIRKSHTFAREHGLPCYEHVLQPRISGFAACVEACLAAGAEPMQLSAGGLSALQLVKLTDGPEAHACAQMLRDAALAHAQMSRGAHAAARGTRPDNSALGATAPSMASVGAPTPVYWSAPALHQLRFGRGIGRLRPETAAAYGLLV